MTNMFLDEFNESSDDYTYVSETARYNYQSDESLVKMLDREYSHVLKIDPFEEYPTNLNLIIDKNIHSVKRAIFLN